MGAFRWTYSGSRHIILISTQDLVKYLQRGGAASSTGKVGAGQCKQWIASASAIDSHSFIAAFPNA
eukprot:2218075-Alexandrium_andersonii.AAC.1